MFVNHCEGAAETDEDHIEISRERREFRDKELP